MSSKLLIDISNNAIEVLDISNLIFEERRQFNPNEILVKEFTEELLYQLIGENESIIDFTTNSINLNCLPKNIRIVKFDGVTYTYTRDLYDGVIKYNKLEHVIYNIPVIYSNYIFECAPNIKKMNITLTDESMCMNYFLGDFELDEVRTYFNNIFSNKSELNIENDMWFIDNDDFILSKNKIRYMLQKNIEIVADIIIDGVTHKFYQSCQE